MYHFSVDMDGMIFFIRFTFKLGNVDKWPFFMYRRKVLRTGLNSVVW